MFEERLGQKRPEYSQNHNIVKSQFQRLAILQIGKVNSPHVSRYIIVYTHLDNTRLRSCTHILFGRIKMITKQHSHPVRH